MTEGWLEIHEGTLVFIESNGFQHVLPSKDIYLLLKEMHPEYTVPAAKSLNETCPNLRINWSTKEVFLRIFLGDDDRVLASPAVQINNENVIFYPSADHAVIDEVWYPFDPSTFESVKNSLPWENHASAPYQMDLDSYSSVYKTSDGKYAIVNELNETDWYKFLANLQQPSGLDATLHDYQLTGYQWLSTLNASNAGGIIADEMGLGKTIQVISLLSEIYENESEASLIIVPLTLVENWRRELLRFAPALTFYVHQGENRVRLSKQLPITHAYSLKNQKANIVITTYDTLLRDQYLLQSIDWNLVILDEAQNIKNLDTKRYQAINGIRARSKFAMTGTPLENRSSDLWAISNTVNPNYLGPLEMFSELADVNPDFVKSALKPIILRRESKDVFTKGELPPMITMDLPLEVTKTEAMVYENLLNELRGSDDGKITIGMFVPLRRAASHPGLIHPEYFEKPFDHSTKLTRLFELLDEFKQSGEKIIVSCEWPAMSDKIIGLSATEQNIPAWAIRGGTPNRQAIVDKFQETKGAAMLVIHPATAGVGLNIQAASQVFHYTLPWNPALEAQVNKRAHRPGQKKRVVVHRPYNLGTIDEAINEILIQKKDMFNELVPKNEEIPTLDIINKVLKIR